MKAARWALMGVYAALAPCWFALGIADSNPAAVVLAIHSVAIAAWVWSSDR